MKSYECGSGMGQRREDQDEPLASCGKRRVTWEGQHQVQYGPSFHLLPGLLTLQTWVPRNLTPALRGSVSSVPGDSLLLRQPP